MPPRIMRFFELIGIPLIGSYGSTECGGVTLCGIGENRPGSLGKPFANVQIRIADDLEILVRGPTVTPGYFKNPQATREALDEDGWFHSRDSVSSMDDGSLRTSGEEGFFYCATVRVFIPGSSSCIGKRPFIPASVLGDHRPFMRRDRSRSATLAAALGA